MIVQLPDGGTATLRERLTYGQARGVRAALLAADADRAAMADLDLALVRAYVSAWSVVDLAGEGVSLDTPELAPDDVIQAIALAAMDAWGTTATLPKVGNGSSPSTPPVPRSRVRTPTSAMSSSLMLTPAGPGPT